MERLAGRVAVVTGAASGIGLAIAGRFAAEGMNIVLADVEEAALAAAEKELREAGADVLGVPTDVSKGEQVDEWARAAVHRFGAVHLVCNNAGVGGGGPMVELETADWAWVLGVNLWGVIHGIRAFLPILLEQDEAHIVNTASMAGLVAAPFMGPYTASKFAVVAISESLVREMALGGTHVGVSVLCPGWVNTNIGESERNRPADLARPQPAEDSPMRQMLQQFLASGMDPGEVADQVADAVRTGRFYILTHPDAAAAVENRAQDIMQGRTPGGATFV
jgi:NAD(P)-dependent dehydrogenase (short-subunit alcohol dehydrogenase family)